MRHALLGARSGSRVAGRRVGGSRLDGRGHRHPSGAPDKGCHPLEAANPAPRSSRSHVDSRPPVAAAAQACCDVPEARIHSGFGGASGGDPWTGCGANGEHAADCARGRSPRDSASRACAADPGVAQPVTEPSGHATQRTGDHRRDLLRLALGI